MVLNFFSVRVVFAGTELTDMRLVVGADAFQKLKEHKPDVEFVDAPYLDE